MIQLGSGNGCGVRRGGLWVLLAGLAVAAALAAGYLLGQVAPLSRAEASSAASAPAGHAHQAPAGSGSDRYQYARPEEHHTAGQPPLPPEKVFPIEPPPRPTKPGVREYRLVVREDSVHEVAPEVRINAWTFNGRVPGPVLRAVEGETLRVTLVNEGTLPHTIHFHGIHPSEMDGVFELVPPGREYTYEFEARPFGVFPYHCHSMPSSQHIHNGLYGMMIVDPVKPRPPMRELALIMSAFDTDRDGEADFYAWNGRAFQYATNPVPLATGEKVRMYVLNMFEELMAPHIHASMFQLYPSGTSTTPSEYTDVTDLAIAERAIMEFDYEYPGTFMFQCHVSEHMELGLMGWFKVSGEPKPRRTAAARSGA